MKFMDRDTPEFPDSHVANILREGYGIEGELHRFTSERDQNMRVSTDDGTFLFKICNTDEDPEVIDLQIAALHQIAQRDPDLPVPRALPTLNGAETGLVAGPDGRRHYVRLMTYVPGDMIRRHPEADTHALRRDTGATLARLDLALRGLFHPASNQQHPWKMSAIADLLPYTEHISDSDARTMAAAIIQKLRDFVLPVTATLRHQIVHQDAHTGNLLIDPANPTEIAGIIDFGDMVHAPLIMELAVAADLHGRPEEASDSLLDLVVGYDGVLPLETEEVEVLVDLALGRLAMTATIAAARAALFPEDDAYIGNEEALWADMERALQAAPDLRRNLHRATRTPMRYQSVQASEQLRADRQRFLGDRSPHFYEKPLHIERGEGMYLVGADGKRYLDFYNNVPTVGHSHPHVVNALTRQIKTLNTHTRYLSNNAVEYAERLTETLADDLDVCLFVNSGSEANDVAWQISQMITGNGGLLVMHNAYHGITEAGIDMTTAKGLEKASHVAEIAAPDDYRGPVTTAAQAQADTKSAIGDLADRGLDPAAFIVDSAMCSSGIPATPEDFLGAIATTVQDAGGLVIADEVQSGFGRLGGMWGHQVLGMTPDIVTLGKPVANGHPMGVVITRREILDAFQAKVRLFSTFGGNPVSCAAGLAVLDVIEREGIVENSRTTGDYLRQRLRELAERQPLIGDVRGRGLLAGLELVTDRETKEPATAQTLRLLEIMRENGALVGKDGKHAHILKLRPPLVATPDDVDVFINILDQSLTELQN